MDSREFLNLLVEALEVEDAVNFSLVTELRDLNEYDSLGVISIITAIDQKYSVTLTGEQLARCTTVNSLKQLVEAKMGT